MLRLSLMQSPGGPETGHVSSSWWPGFLTALTAPSFSGCLVLGVGSHGYALCLVGLTGVSPSSYKKTQETLSQAGQKTSAALSTMGSAISRKLGDMR